MPASSGPRSVRTDRGALLAPAVLFGLAASGVAASIMVLAARMRGTLGEVSVGLIAGEASPHRLSEPLGYWNAMGVVAALIAALALAGSAHLTRPAVRTALTGGLPAVIATAVLTRSIDGAAVGALAFVLLSLFAARRTATFLHAGAAATGGAIASWAILNDAALAHGTGPAETRTILWVMGGCALAAALGAGATRGTPPTRPALRRMMLTVVGSTFVGLLFAGVLAAPTIGDRVAQATELRPTSGLTAGHDGSFDLGTGQRPALWRTAIDASQGPDRLADVTPFAFAFDRVAPTGVVARNAHSVYLDVLTQHGVVGLTLLGVAMIGGGLLLLRSRRVAATDAARGLAAASVATLGAIAVGVGVDWYWELAAIRALTFGLLAAGAVPLALHAWHRRSNEPGWRRFLAIAVAAMPVVLLLVAATQLRTSSIDAGVTASQAAVRAGDLNGARAGADAAIRADDAGTSGLVQRALVEERAGALGAARRALRLALRRTPQDWRLRVLLARVQAESGRPAAAYAQLVAAQIARPHSAFLVTSAELPVRNGAAQWCTVTSAAQRQYCERLPRADGSWELPGDRRLPGAGVLPPQTLEVLARDQRSSNPDDQARAAILSRILRARPPVPAPPVTRTPPIPAG